MATCKWCGQEMTDENSKTCTGSTEVEFPDGSKMKAVPYDDGEPGQRCHDCRVEAGGYHHPGCDMERCPRCGGQLISCGCLDAEADFWEDSLGFPG